MMANDLLGFIKELKLEKPFICGWSMGASVALEFAMNFPDEAKALFCCGGSPPLSDAEIRELIQEEELLVQNPEIVERMETLHSHVYGADYWKDLVKQLHSLMREGYAKEPFCKVTVPTLILCSDGEERPGVAAYAALSRELVQSELIVIPQEDHFYPTTNVEMFTKIITEFFIRGGD
jgi:pimeloyl-ACP methyl ester carboxylesterase